MGGVYGVVGIGCEKEEWIMICMVLYECVGERETGETAR